MHRLPTAVVSLVVEHRLLRAQAPESTGSITVARWLSCPAACGIFPDQGSDPPPLHWQADPQPLGHQGSPELPLLLLFFFLIFKIYLAVSGLSSSMQDLCFGLFF